jgi:hypothetical protein
MAGMKGQFQADFGTLRSTFLGIDTNRIGLQGEQVDLADEGRRAVKAIEMKTRNDQLRHQARMAQMRMDQVKEQAYDDLTTSLVSQGFGLISNVMRKNRDEKQMRELKEAMGLIKPDEIPGIDPQRFLSPDPDEILNKSVPKDPWDLIPKGGFA